MVSKPNFLQRVKDFYSCDHAINRLRTIFVLIAISFTLSVLFRANGLDRAASFATGLTMAWAVVALVLFLRRETQK